MTLVSIKIFQFDAEALITIDEFLLIFTKNRAKKITDIYKVPKMAGKLCSKKNRIFKY